MALNFPTTPTLNQEYTLGNVTWRWNGEAWVILPPTEVQYEEIDTTDLTVTNNTTLNNLTINGTITGLSISLSDLDNVDVSSPNDQDVLQYSQSAGQWIAANIAVSGGGSSFNGGTIVNPLFIDNSTASTGSQSGALRVTGGAGIQGNVNIGGILTVEDDDLYIRSGSGLRLYNAENTAYVSLRSPTTPANTVYTLPATDGSAGQFLRTNGEGGLSWASAAGAGGGTPPGGINLQVQFNNNNSFDGDAGLTFDPNQQLLTAPDITSTGVITINATDESTTDSTGALQIAGGVGIAKQLNVSGSTSKFTGNVNSTSINTGTIVVTGGVGISQTVNVGSNVSADTEPTDPSHLTNKRYVDANILAFSVAFGA